jgi:uncharacterized tellurite resistance protein B-like protein
MGILEQFEHHKKKQDKEHFVDLIQIALADGIIDPAELEMLQRVGRNMGLTDPEVEELIELTSKTSFNPPYEFSERFEQAYNIVKMILADGVIDKNEMLLANKLSIKLGFSETEIPNMLNLLIEGIKQGKDAEDLFDEYRKKRKI